MLLQIDGSPHDWLDGRGPRLTRRAAIDEATGTVAGAVWRDQEASTGYLQLLAQIVTTHGCPEAVYHERSGLFVHHDHERETIAEQLAGAREPRQVMRAFGALGIASITAHSPQAKSRIERLFGTLQDRLVVELRLAGAATLAEATRVLAAYLPRFHAQFGVPAADPTVAYRPLPAAVDLRQVWCVTQRRVVANDDTIQIEGQRLQLLPGRARLSYVRATVEVRDHLDGGRSVWYQEHEIAWRPAPPDARAVRPRPGTAVGMAAGGAAARSPTGGQPPAQTEAAPSVVPAPQTSRR